MRLGGIKMDASGIEMNGVQVVSTAANAANPGQRIELVDHPWLPSSKVLFTTSALFFVGAATAVGLAMISAPWISLGVLPLLFSGASFLVIGRGKRRREAVEERRANDAVRALARRLEVHLTQTDARCTVDHLVKSTGFESSEVIRALELLRRTGRLVEDLDIENGTFFYALTTADDAPSKAHLSLSDRLSELSTVKKEDS